MISSWWNALIPLGLVAILLKITGVLAIPWTTTLAPLLMWVGGYAGIGLMLFIFYILELVALHKDEG